MILTEETRYFRARSLALQWGNRLLDIAFYFVLGFSFAIWSIGGGL